MRQGQAKGGKEKRSLSKREISFASGTAEWKNKGLEESTAFMRSTPVTGRRGGEKININRGRKKEDG